MYKYLFILIFLLSFFSQTNAQLISDFRVNDDAYGNEQDYAKIGVDSLGKFVIVWSDRRNPNPSKTDVYFQMFDYNAVKYGANIKVNGDSSAWYPAIAVNKSGKFAICWCGYYGGNIISKLYNYNGTPLTSEIKINDTVGCINPSIILNNSGSLFVISWYNGYNDRIYFQIINSNGVKIGNNKIVDDTATYKENAKPKIIFKKNNSFIITWHDNRPPCPFQSGCADIYYQLIDSNGNKVGTNNKVNDDMDSTNYQTNPAICSDSSGKYVITWNDNRLSQSTTANVFAQVFDKNGVKTGLNYLVPQTENGWDDINPVISSRINGDFVIGWTGFHPNKPYPWFQRYKNTLVPFGINYFLTNQILSADKYYNDVAIYNNKIISIWIDRRNDTQGDIYCNIRSFTNPDSTVGIIKISNEIPEKYKLYQNYPNPFNPSTNIKYQIKENKFVTLKVFDILGKEVATFVNQKQSPGTYEATFDGSKLSSGIYFYTLYADGLLIDCKKMILMK